MVTNMANDRLIIAIDRLERAMTRVESRTRALTLHGDGSQLLAKHHRLRDRVEDAIGRIDALIESAEG